MLALCVCVCFMTGLHNLYPRQHFVFLFSYQSYDVTVRLLLAKTPADQTLYLSSALQTGLWVEKAKMHSGQNLSVVSQVPKSKKGEEEQDSAILNNSEKLSGDLTQHKKLSSKHNSPTQQRNNCVACHTCLSYLC